PPTLGSLARSLLAECMPLSDGDRAVALAAYRLLAGGEPVALADLAQAVRRDEDAVRSLLWRWPDVYYDGEGRIVGFWGLDLRQTAHRFEVEGRSLFTWCAWDPLFLAAILQREARVESRCPATGAGIVVTVGPRGVVQVTPAEAVLSFMKDSCTGDSVIDRFCRYVVFFASEEAAQPWIAKHPGTVVLSIDEAFELGRLLNAERFGSVTQG
ncbi:MAG TPA: alkylmercury lyase MerB, partial [Acidimicrobiales bacterium]|nr:alkylmercury lyase MerB [Acidimicrobiales bacterium]